MSTSRKRGRAAKGLEEEHIPLLELVNELRREKKELKAKAFAYARHKKDAEKGMIAFGNRLGAERDVVDEGVKKLKDRVGSLQEEIARVASELEGITRECNGLSASFQL